MRFGDIWPILLWSSKTDKVVKCCLDFKDSTVNALESVRDFDFPLKLCFDKLAFSIVKEIFCCGDPGSTTNKTEQKLCMISMVYLKELIGYNYSDNYYVNFLQESERYYGFRSLDNENVKKHFVQISYIINEIYEDFPDKKEEKIIYDIIDGNIDTLEVNIKKSVF
jgi:hypothetical protein